MCAFLDAFCLFPILNHLIYTSLKMHPSAVDTAAAKCTRGRLHARQERRAGGIPRQTPGWGDKGRVSVIVDKWANINSCCGAPGSAARLRGNDDNTSRVLGRCGNNKSCHHLSLMTPRELCIRSAHSLRGFVLGAIVCERDTQCSRTTTQSSIIIAFLTALPPYLCARKRQASVEEPVFDWLIDHFTVFNLAKKSQS